jgi:hypothetical protein
MLESESRVVRQFSIARLLAQVSPLDAPVTDKPQGAYHLLGIGPRSDTVIVMRIRNGQIMLILLTLGLFNLLVAEVGAQTSTQKAGSADLQAVLSWLPEDTETISVARGPFVLNSKIARSSADVDENENRVVSDRELGEPFETLPLSLFGFKEGLLFPHLKGKRISLAIEGARHFRPPSGLGEMPYEGCAIALFVDDLNTDMASFVKDNRKSILKVEQIEGQVVAVFQEKLENDTWTAFVASPNKHILAVATNRDYLREILARLQGKQGNRALPNDLPEWKYVNTDLQFWGLRHFDRTQAKLDPSSPFGGQKSANDADEQAIGLVYVFDRSNGTTAKITYLTGDMSLGSRPDATLLSMGKGPGAAALDIKYREVAPAVLEGSYTLKKLGQVQFFFFVLMGMLGHAVFL